MGVAGWFFMPPELSRLCDVHDAICSIRLCYQIGHCSTQRTKCQTLNKANQSLQCCTLIAKKNTRYPSDPVSCRNSTKWPDCLLERGTKRKKKFPRAIMHLCQQQVELQSQSFIFNFIRVSGQTNVLLISSLLLLKRGRTARGRKLDYRE